MISEAAKVGMSINRPKEIVCRPEELEKKLRAEFKGMKYDLVMILVPFKDNETYAKIKLIGDTELKVPSQFVLQKNVNGKPTTIHNIILKMNSKLGGTNQKLSLDGERMVSPIFNEPVSLLFDFI